MATPTSISHYEILGEIGRGAMGVVYEARDQVLGRTVALKVVQPAADGDELQGYEERFLDEARSAAALQHPGIVVVYEVGRDPGSGVLFIALELLRGSTLAELAAAGSLEWRAALRIVAQVARALDHAHSRGVVHRDIKPANVIVLDSGEVKVTDFGIARFERIRERLTSTGQFIGTPLFTAPEQALVEEVDGRADVFSLASVAYTLLAGRAPFQAPTIPGIVHRVVYEEPEPLGGLLPDLPPDVERVLARALAKDPAERYQTAGAFADDAEDVLAGRPPRHAAADDLVVVGDSSPSHTVRLPGGATRAPVADADRSDPRDASDTRTSIPPFASVPKPRDPRPSRAALAVAVALLALVALFLWAPRAPNATRPATSSSPRSTPAAAQPAGADGAPRASAPMPAANPAGEAAADPGRLRIEFDHPLRRGRLRVFVDDVLALDEALAGQQRKKALVFKVHEGTLREELEIAPGLHEVRIEVAWDDNRKIERIVGSFRSGATRTLDASLGGRLRRELTLEWR